MEKSAEFFPLNGKKDHIISIEKRGVRLLKGTWSSSAGAGVCLVVDFFEAFDGYVGVDLGCGQGGVAK